MDEVAQFSEVGDRYGEQLARGLRLTGETAEYYASRRIARMRDIVADREHSATAILDFGCGTGASFSLLRAHFPNARIIGFEPAAGLRVLAQQAAMQAGVQVLSETTLSLDSAVDVVYCNGVFHHIPEREQDAAMASVHRALRRRGLAFIWENSPYNPGTRLIMSRVSFDRDAVLLTPRVMRALQARRGLLPVVTEYHFVFPRALAFARALEPALRRLPFGGQYVAVGERADQPAAPGHA